MRMKRISPPAWARAPRVAVDGVSAADYQALVQQRDGMLATVHAEIVAYLSDPRLCFDDDLFPARGRLTGEYYVGDETYIAHASPTWFHISIRCRCTEGPKPGMDRDDDYLGLEVWLKYSPARPGVFEVCGTDSSSI